MYFQALDDKGECVGVYKDGGLYFEELPDELQRTWKYAEFLGDLDVEYASLYAPNKSLADVCPSHLVDRWLEVEAKLKAFYRSFVLGKVDLNENCFFDLVPTTFLKDYCKLKNQITQHVFENYERPANYDFLADLTKVLTKIRRQKVNIDQSALNRLRITDKGKHLNARLGSVTPYCHYRINGTVTGRLAGEPNTFPIMTLNKDFRHIVQPTNDWFVELDFNAAELRTLMALGGSTPPLEDIHEWNARNLFNKGTTRGEAKLGLLSWLYDENKTNERFAAVYDRDAVRSKFWNNGEVKTIFGRTIPADRSHALNYIVQSTTADLVLRQAIKVNEAMEGLESFIAFIIHDSIVLDMKEGERHKIPELLKVFSDTDLGKFLVNVRAGFNFGEMKEINL